ncbi:MAG: hypothetical protein KC910_16605 [Candidatus Eremiobacteraeota bacterium]|nr:hypothetical protein [Candidatus Eremiobacteraeota bacterium]
MILVLVVGVLVVASAATLFQLGLTHQDNARDGARRLAESAVQTAIARLLQDPTLDETTLPSLEVSLPSYPGATGAVALEAGEATRLGVPLSVNNLNGGGDRPGWGSTVVRAQTANLVGVGRYRGREHKIEVILHIPKFPYVVSSSVPIHGDKLHVFGVSNPAALSGGFSGVPPDQREPGHIVTNAPDQTNPSLELVGSSTVIEGDAQSRGTVDVAPEATVNGEQRSMADLVPMPQIDVTTLDTASRAGVSVISTGSLGATTLSGFHRRSGDLAVSGGLALDGGVVYVDGAVTIDGGLSGTGAVIATGPVTVRGGGALTGSSGTAVVAKGAITLEGTSSTQEADFRGLLYTEGNLLARYTNVAGSVVVNNPDPAGNVTLEESTLVESAEIGSISVPVSTMVPGPAGGLTPLPATLHANLISGGDPYGYGVAPVLQAVGSTGSTAPVLFTANMNGPREDYSTPPPGYPVTHPPTTAEPWYEIGVPSPMPADPISLGSIPINNPKSAGPAHTVAPDGRGGQNVFVGVFTDRASARAALVSVATDWGSANAAAATDAFLDAAAQYVVDTAPEFVNTWNANSRALGQAAVSSTGTGPLVPMIVLWQLDLSQFYNMADRIRILSWRDL